MDNLSHICRSMLININSNLQNVIYEVVIQEDILPIDLPSIDAPKGGDIPPVDLPLIDAPEGGDVVVEVPKHDTFQDSILTIVSQILYQTIYEPKSDPHLYLEFEINFKEFELILVKFALLVS